MWARWKGPTPGYLEQSRQLTEARAAQPWLAQGSHTVQRQALRDLDQAWRNFFAGTHHRPTWRKRGGSEGLRVVAPRRCGSVRTTAAGRPPWSPKSAGSHPAHPGPGRLEVLPDHPRPGRTLAPGVRRGARTDPWTGHR
jgi:hypothetical protein